jgi:hypothetical protein
MAYLKLKECQEEAEIDPHCKRLKKHQDNKG